MHSKRTESETSQAEIAQLRGQAVARMAEVAVWRWQVASLLAIGEMRLVPTIVSFDATPINFDRVGHAYSHRTAHGAVEAAKKRVPVIAGTGSNSTAEAIDLTKHAGRAGAKGRQEGISGED